MSNLNVKCLNPICGETAHILILGSAPGDESLKKQEYYFKNSNSFWYIMSQLFNNGCEFGNYEEKIACMMRNKIALWDVIDSCHRDGSSDKNITGVTYNDLEQFIDKHHISRIVFNGKYAYELFIKNFKTNADLIVAPSTSNNYSLAKEIKVEQWRGALNEL